MWKGDLNSEELSHAISACPSDDVRLYTGHDDITPLPSTVCLISEPGSLTTSNAALYASTTIDHDDIPIDSYAKSPPSSGSPDPLATLHSTPSLEGSSIMLTDDSDADFSPSEFVGNDD
ncbi:hypothetical protein SARC_05330 [Sphaeroforma arctica JP610]|uniref:Uncharacterized protein n=1 Tax=Sphaeroforma arctica JP610 TaxID=667725 RepID=A0A0L0G0J3_9EUKA|nr:hypothetical protein SARC_05330 [Sphaeroforma arctica JP610]KNC82379.1 hypothetical protein SARC_05330 [Sphaeroforma arctica JP610]|eukprot:XP_014156281.1 hypothetical protein SARC_05330 [Sphaeroforma arctica JP610]